MRVLISLTSIAQRIMDAITRSLDFIGAALLRLYLVPIFWVAGNNKWNPLDADSSLDSTIAWFETGLGLPFPALNAYLAWGAEYIGAILLALGLATRWICIPMMTTMVVAVTTVHFKHGWQSVYDGSSPFAPPAIGEAMERLDRAEYILQEHGNYDWLTEYGNFVMLNNGMEWAATYFIMLLALLFIGGGRFISLDYWIRRKFNP